MINITGEKKSITEYLKQFVETKTDNNDVNEVRARCGKFKEQINELSEKVDNCITREDMEELVADIRNSFELFLNKTPRENDTKFEERLNAFQAKIDDINFKLDALGLDQVEILPAKKKVPKLELALKKK